MPVIYLRHPEYGTKVASQEQEAQYDEGNGWVRYELNPVPVTDVAEPATAQTNVTPIREKRKYTRRA